MSSLINTTIKPFKATAFHNGKFVQVSDADLKGKWSVFFFYPADFTFVCPTELGRPADQLRRVQEAGRRGLRRLHRHALHAQGVARHVGHHQEDQVPDGRRPDATPRRNFGVLIEDEGLALRGTFVVNPEGQIKVAESPRQRHRPRRQGAAAQGAGRAVRRHAPGRSVPGQVEARREDAGPVARPGRQDLTSCPHPPASAGGASWKIPDMLDDNLRTQLQSYLGRMTRPIVLVATLDDTEASRELHALLEDVASLSPLITLETRSADGAVRSPSFSVSRIGEDSGIRFAGIPMGHEFTSLVLALLHAGGHPPKVDAAVIEQIAGLDGDFEFETYISLSCQNCPEVVQALNLMAVLNPRIRSTMIDGALFQAEVEAREVMAVPSVYLNGQPFAQGRMTVEEILAKLDTKSEARRATQLKDKGPFDVLIVGGGPAGASAAIYAARKGIRTGVVTERFGGQVLDTMGIENFISVQETEGPKLAAALENHVKTYDVDVMNLQRATGLLPAGDSGLVGVQLASGVTLRSRSVIPGYRCPLAGNERAGRARVSREGRRVLPALRRAALQGQAGRRHRWRQLRRGGCDRSRRHRCPRDAHRVRRGAACRRGPATEAP